MVAESVSAAARRLYEKNREDEVTALLTQVDTQVPYSNITWILPDVPDLYKPACSGVTGCTAPNAQIGC